MKYRFGPYELHPDVPILLEGADTVPAPPRVLAGLVFLVERRHTAVGKRELMEALWRDAFVEEGSLTQMISTLRKVLAPGFPDSSPIQTIPRIGYRFCAEVTELRDPPETALAAIPLTVQTPPTAQPSPNRRPLWLALALATCVVAFAIVFAVSRRSAHHAAQHPGRPSIAILPFQNLSASPENAWISTALQETLATNLRLNGGLLVLPGEEVNRAMTEVHNEASPDLGPDSLRRLGADLDCQNAVTGAYLLRNGTLRLDLRLVDLHTGATLREQAFERPDSQMLPMIAQVSAQIRDSFKLPPDAAGLPEKLASGIDPAAYKLFVEAIQQNQIYNGKAASELLEKSIAIDPSFPLAHLQLSAAYSGLGQERQAVQQAELALQLSGSLDREQQLVIRARVQSAKHLFPDAADTYRTLFRFFPDNLGYGRMLIQSLSSAGSNDQALEEVNSLLARSDSAAKDDPLLFSVIADLYSTLGNWPESLSWAQRGAALSQRRGAAILYERLLTTESQAQLYLKQLAPALTETTEALDLARQYHDLSGELRALNRLGQIASAHDDWAGARTSLLAALALERSRDQTQRETHTLIDLSQAEEGLRDLPAARLTSLQALQAADRLAMPEVHVEAALQVARVQADLGQTDLAQRTATQARDQAAQIHDAALEAAAAKVLLRLETARSRGAHGPA